MWDPISSAVGGAVRGLLSSVATIFRESRQDKRRKERLKAMLSSPRFEFRSLPQLAASIGADEVATKHLLLEIGARPSETDPGLWTLKPSPMRH